MDGVLSDAAGRQHHLERPWRDWDAFFEAVGEDALITEVARLLEVLDPDAAHRPAHRPPDPVQRQTLAWLDEHDLRWDLLVMRDWGDYGAARDFKRDAVARPARATASTSGSPSRTTAATSTCSTARACPASTSTPATTTERVSPGSS